MNTTDRQKDILFHAFTLACDQGIQELTTKNLAHSIGVTEPALYRHFSSKDAILSAMIDHIIAIRESIWESVYTEAKDPIGQLRLFFTLQAKEFTQFPPASIMLQSDIIFQKETAHRDRIHGMMKKNRERLRGILEEGSHTGAFRSDIDADYTALMLIGGFRMQVTCWKAQCAACYTRTRTAKDNRDCPASCAISLEEETGYFLEATLQLIKS